ncbi:MAG: carbonic anhydrase [Gammaproteobacteria bacterium]|nr:carbonic anhydrase [Gammaproteobacteria bacterium]
MIAGTEALQRLKEGNQRFASGARNVGTMVRQFHRAEIVEAQAPFAIILGCSDSRVPAEIVFDQGLGDLFVIRVAGNIVAPSQVGSIEFAVEQFGTPLVVVLGHSMCGAVRATLDEMAKTSDPSSSNVLSIVNRIRPTIEILQLTELRDDPEQLLKTAIRANILASTNHLRHGSQMLEQLVQDEALTIVGAEYSLETGLVEFMSNV